MKFIYFFFRILFFYFLFVAAFRLIIFLIKYFFKRNASKDKTYSRKENIIDAEYEEIE